MLWITAVLISLNVGVALGQCPAYWHLFGERCINVTTKVGSWAEGMQYCKTMGGQLVNIDTQDLQMLLSFIVARNITFHTENEYKYHYFHDLGIDVTQTSSVTFTVKACHDAHIALSKTKGLDTSDTYEIVIGGWSDSESVIRDCKQCTERDMVAVIITVCFNRLKSLIQLSARNGKNEEIKLLMYTYTPGKFWVGANDLVKENEWHWLPSQSPVSEYTNWLLGQPDNANGNQNCLVLEANNGMKWQDDNCDVNRNFICEKKVDDMSGIVG